MMPPPRIPDQESQKRRGAASAGEKAEAAEAAVIFEKERAEAEDARLRFEMEQVANCYISIKTSDNPLQ